MAAVYDAMLAARVFGEPARFKRMVRAFVQKVLHDPGAVGSVD